MQEEHQRWCNLRTSWCRQAWLKTFTHPKEVAHLSSSRIHMGNDICRCPFSPFLLCSSYVFMHLASKLLYYCKGLFHNDANFHTIDHLAFLFQKVIFWWSLALHKIKIQYSKVVPSFLVELGFLWSNDMKVLIRQRSSQPKLLFGWGYTTTFLDSLCTGGNKYRRIHMHIQTTLERKLATYARVRIWRWTNLPRWTQ